MGLLFVHAGCLLLRVPVLGIADNGDFWRVTDPAGLVAVGDTRSRHPVRFYRRDRSTPHGDFASSPILMAKLADRCLSWLSPNEHFDLRQLGLLNLIVSLGFALLLVRAKLPVILKPALLWVFFDPNYLLYFNSFYTDSMMLLCIFGIMAVCSAGDLSASSPRKRMLTASGIALLAAAGGFVKSQYMLFPAIVSVSLLAWTVRRVGLRKRTTYFLLAVLTAAAAAFPVFHAYGRSFRFTTNDYHAVFYGMAKLSNEPERVLASLGIPAENAAYAGVSAFDRSTRQKVLRGTGIPFPRHHISRARLLQLYLTQETGAAIRALGHIRDSFTRSNLSYLGHFEESSGKGKAQYNTWWQFSNPRDAVFMAAPWLFWAVLGLQCCLFVRLLWRNEWQGMNLAFTILFLQILSQMVVVILGDGVHGIQRKFVTSRLAFDLNLAIMCGLWLPPMTRAMAAEVRASWNRQ